MMGKADAVIFDFDGVIADTREDVWDSVEYAANAVGGAVDKEFMEDTSHVALPEEELFRHINPLPPGQLFDAFCSCLLYTSYIGTDSRSDCSYKGYC